VRLSAVLYFMTSSMLVQFTTKVRGFSCAPPVQPSSHHRALCAVASPWRCNGAQAAACCHRGPAGRHECCRGQQRRHPPATAAGMAPRAGAVGGTRPPACGLMARQPRACELGTLGSLVQRLPSC
jgi:hypothetical protein